MVVVVVVVPGGTTTVTSVLMQLSGSTLGGTQFVLGAVTSAVFSMLVPVNVAKMVPVTAP